MVHFALSLLLYADIMKTAVRTQHPAPFHHCLPFLFSARTESNSLVPVVIFSSCARRDFGSKRVISKSFVILFLKNINHHALIL